MDQGKWNLIPQDIFKKCILIIREDFFQVANYKLLAISREAVSRAWISWFVAWVFGGLTGTARIHWSTLPISWSYINMNSLTKMVLVGNSLGGHVAILYIHHHPENVSRLF
jgi:hypothetical protein